MAETARIAEGHAGRPADDHIQSGHRRVGKNAVGKKLPAYAERQQQQGGQRQADAEDPAFGAGEKEFTHSG